MTSPSPELPARLLAEADWVTALARALVADPGTADDVAQAAWLDVLQAPAAAPDNPRAWLATIVRRKVLRFRRGNRRASQREAVVAAAAAAATVPSAAELTERVEMQRQLADAVLALEEPYRATVALRYFEGLDVAAIAVRTQCPANTVRSRLQRGLLQLRERLDRGPGGRDRWLPAVLVLARRPLARGAAGSGAGLATVIALAIPMQKILLAAAALAAGILVAMALWPAAAPPQLSPDGSPPPPAAVAAAGPAERAAEPLAADRPLRTAASPAAAPAKGRRLVDRTGAPLAGVAMRSESPFAVRWQGGDRGWLSSSERSLRLSAEDEARLQRDPAFCAEFFARFAHPEEWRATVLGTPLPERETRSDGEGRFTFAATIDGPDERIVVGDPAFVLVAIGRRDAEPWRAGPAARIELRVRSASGEPLRDAFAQAAVLQDGSVRALPGQPELRSDATGAVLVRRALAGGIVQVRCDGYANALVPLGDQPQQQHEVVLQRRADGPAPQLAGLVVDGGGRPVAAAAVWFGRRQARTGADGRFALATDGAAPQQALTVVAKGFALHQRDGFGATLAAGSAGGAEVLVVLDAEPATARGLVLGSDGAPAADVWVGLVDPTLLDVSFEGVEARVGGWSGGVRTAADGTFALAGLAGRAYRLRAIDPRTGASVTAPPWRPGQADLVLRLPTDLRRGVAGQVREGGRGVAGATVEVAFCTHITKGGGTMFDAAPAVTADAEGRFVLPFLPRREAWLGIRVGGALRAMLPAESLAPAGELELALDGPRWLQVVGSEHPEPRPLHFELASGSVVAANALLAADGSAPPVPIPATATAVLVGAGPTAARLELTDDRAVLLRVR